MGKLPKKEPATKRKRSFVSKKLWPIIRQLTPAEGLALVCLTAWVKPETGVAQASDRQVCNQTGVSRDVMKRLRRKLAGLGIPVTPGDYLSHDSCSYDFRKVLDAATSSEARRAPERARAVAAPAAGALAATHASHRPAASVQETPGLGAKGTHGEGADGTERGGAKSTQPRPERSAPSSVQLRADTGVFSARGAPATPATEAVSAGHESTGSEGSEAAESRTSAGIDQGGGIGEAAEAWDGEAYAALTIHTGAPTDSKAASLSQSIPATESTSTTTLRDHGATPEWELTASAQTAPAWPLDFWDDSLEREVEARRAQLRIPLEEPSPPPLPPYEQWISRR